MRKRYFIPINFMPEGYVFTGIHWVNVVQAVIVVLSIIVPAFKYLPFGIKGKIYASIIFAIPLGGFTLIGVNGLSITSFLANVFETKRYGRIYSKPNNSDKITRQKNLERKRHKQLRENEKERKRLEKEEARMRKRRRKEEDDE